MSEILEKHKQSFESDPSNMQAFDALEEHLFMAGQWNKLVELYEHYCAHDQESAALLENYLDRLHGEQWRGRTGAERGAAAAPATMGREEALEILGLSGVPDEAEVIAAHRRLMQKLHPDRGGSTYLAAKINQAKDFLLKES